MYLTTVPPTVSEKDLQQLRLVAYGRHNNYPQEALYSARRAGVASACVDVLAEFLSGNGFKDELFGGTVANAEGQTFNDLLDLLAWDCAMFNGFALHVNYNILGEIANIHYQPFKDVRLGLPNDWGKYDTLRVWDNYAGESPRLHTYYGDIRTFQRFNPANVLEEIEACGGIENYGGQILYYTDNAGVYPVSAIDSVWNEVGALAYYSEFVQNYIRNQFSASAIVSHADDLVSADNIEYNKEAIRQMGGTQNAGAILYLTGAINVSQLSSNRLAEEMEVLYNTLSDAIVSAFNVPSILVSRSRNGGGFPNQDELINAFNYFNGQTQKRRKILEREFSKIASNWAWGMPVYSEIEPKHFGDRPDEAAAPTAGDALEADPNAQDANKLAQANLRGSVGGVQGILALQASVSAGTTTIGAAITMLIEIFGFDERTARSILGSPDPQPQPAQV